MQKNITKYLIILIFITLLLVIMPAGEIFPEDTGNTGMGNDSDIGISLEINNFYISTIEGIISPPISNFIARCLEKSSDSGYGLIILMDTPGGLEASMREIITDILNTDIPVIVFVYPEGARAASAGTFITYASDLAVMAPFTTIGAAHPVNLGGEGQSSGDMLDKVTNDSISYIKNLAVSRGRNAEWAEMAVRESVSITAEEALRLGVIDLSVQNIEELLKEINGMTIKKSDKSFFINTGAGTAEEIEMNFITQFLHIIVNPNIAYILFILGIFGIIYEFSQPGLGVSGAVGVLLLILAFYSFSILPINYAGLALIILAIILFILDIALGLGGILSIAGVSSLIIGSFLLIDTGAPYLRIARSLIIAASIVVSGFLIIIIRAVYRVHRMKPATGEEGIIGETAAVLKDLDPEGLVKVSGEIWKAVSADGSKIKKGQTVKIISLEGLTLKVNLLINNKQKNKKGG
jgi:membrane-bound serine protease (ClpP class)